MNGDPETTVPNRDPRAAWRGRRRNGGIRGGPLQSTGRPADRGDPVDPENFPRFFVDGVHRSLHAIVTRPFCGPSSQRRSQ